jgi:predicted TIM-barrel fold metal-dependent hydrolase
LTEKSLYECGRRRYPRAYLSRRDAALPGRLASARGEAPIELYLDNLRAAGIDRAVLAAASLFEDNNDYALTATAAHPNLRTTVIVDPATDDYALREMASAGAVGVRLQWRSTPSPPDLADPVWQRFLRGLANGLACNCTTGDRLPAAIAAIERSGVPLVIDHFGRPDVTLGVNCTGFQAVLGAVERGRCWVKLSADFRIGSDALVRQLTDALLRHAGTDRLFWGSDWPLRGVRGRHDLWPGDLSLRNAGVRSSRA